jgi:hypothetical protein
VSCINSVIEYASTLDAALALLLAHALDAKALPLAPSLVPTLDTALEGSLAFALAPTIGCLS